MNIDTKQVVAQGTIHLVCTKNFLENYHFLTSYMCIYQGVRNVSFLKNIGYVLALPGLGGGA